MPTNLNALIRYKQIDQCLRSPYLNATIERLIEACSNQIAECRGVYKLVSERTIRDDIRIMRSDILGFNAPIIVNNGIYSYSDNNFSIFQQEIKQDDLLEKILIMLIDERPNIKNLRVDVHISALSKLLNKPSIATQLDIFEDVPLYDAPIQTLDRLSKLMARDSFLNLKDNKQQSISIPTIHYLWGSILESI